MTLSGLLMFSISLHSYTATIKLNCSWTDEAARAGIPRSPLPLGSGDATGGLDSMHRQTAV
ncbi:hypothetical protein [Paenibacillus sp. FSL L8-0709]|uniref:hypothetical protein n=1 Tax=Paenibacillus sp. FSL L8-0709 TaxID=2975312 RepID=UPI0030F7D6E2